MMFNSRCCWLLMICMMGACTRDRAPDRARAHDRARARSKPAPTPAPAEKLVTIGIEGTPQQIVLRLVRPPSSLPFYTYVPADMIAETRASAAGEAHYFIANFAGQRHDNAYLLIFVFPLVATQGDAIPVVQAYRAAHHRPGYFSSVELKMHNGRYYYIAQFYPGEYADGFGPRAQRIMDEWQWLDPTPSRPRNE